MGTWFDGLAKRSARAEQSDDAGLTRRQVLARGALVTGAAWTAPMLLSVRPAFAGASMCPRRGDNKKQTSYQQCGNGTFECCEPGETCLPSNTTPVTYGCSIPLGGLCGNQGVGQGGATCNGGLSTCNSANAQNPSICGGPGARCNFVDPTAMPCSPGVTCGTDNICGGLDATCTADSECNTTNGTPRTCDELPLGTGLCV